MKNEKMAYLGGDLLKKGSVMLRNAEAEELRNVGVKLYSPIEDKEINDKQNQSKEDNDGLAEKIVKKDTKAIIDSDYIIIEPQENALGTMVELGQIKGMKDASKMIKDILLKFIEDPEYDDNNLIIDMVDLADKLNKKVYPHYEDIRRTDIEECGDRRSLGINQYVYGVCLDLTDGEGFYEWEDIVREMKKEYRQDWHNEYVELIKKSLKESKELYLESDKRLYKSSRIVEDLKDIFKQSDIGNINDFYKEIYRLSRIEEFDGKELGEYMFVSNYYKDNLKMEIDYRNVMRSQEV